MNNRSKVIKRVSIVGIFINFFLVIIKFIAGLMTKSNALIADSIHSLEDMSSSILSYIGAKISSKKPSLKYSLGYGKAEYIFSFLISIFIILTSFSIFINSIKSIFAKDMVSFSYISVLVCIVTIIIKIVLYIYTSMKYKKTHSILIKVISVDHRNDIYITTATLIGIICSYFGITIVDGILAVFISIWLGITGVKIFISSIEVLMDKSIGEKEQLEIKKEILNNEEVLRINKFILKPIGSNYILSVSLCINDCNDINFIYEITSRLKKQISYRFKNIEETFIEVETM